VVRATILDDATIARRAAKLGQERKKPKTEWGSGCGGQTDRAQTMAEWEL
jgi:hypothetical protein